MSPSLSDLCQRGPYPVGALQTEIPSPLDPIDPDRRLPTEIWYPARASAQDERGKGRPSRPLPANFDRSFDAPHPLGLAHQASTGLAPSTESARLIAFSHGNSGLRQQSTFLTTHLASWGFVVVAPDHVGNTWSEMLSLTDAEERHRVHLRARSQRPNDILTTIRALLDNGHERDRLPPLVATSVGVLGHSYGGWTTLKIPALESRIRAMCCLAPASEPFVGRKAFDPQELPIADAIDVLILAARDDVLVDLDTSIRPLVDRLGPAARLEIIDAADHFHFCDGIEFLHKMHEINPRPNQLRPTRPLGELRGESEMHALLRERVTRFFLDTIGENE